MTEFNKKLFSELCEEDRIMRPYDGESIGTYNEKRIHRILKRLVCEDASCYEQKIGRYVADVLSEGHLTEIQTSSFRPLGKKIKFYLTQTDFSVTVIRPVICEKTVIRMDKETGEIISQKRSPKHERDTDVLCDLYYLSPFLGDPRFCIKLLHITAEEYRFSERVRYRKSGAFDKDLCPVSLVGCTQISSVFDVRKILPTELTEKPFTSPEFAKLTKLRARRLSMALSLLMSLGILTREKDGRQYIYSVTQCV
ncbi:MAG: winged helix-turn-helix transcriptional regulator [Ruminococcaceae bacterium]|nr:winged helix-turn-helix transcriptional regulator [Oscillospiraceae bacterium]